MRIIDNEEEFKNYAYIRIELISHVNGEDPEVRQAKIRQLKSIFQAVFVGAFCISSKLKKQEHSLHHRGHRGQSVGLLSGVPLVEDEAVQGQVRVEPVQLLGSAHGRVDVDEGLLAGQEAQVPRRQHDDVDHDLGLWEGLTPAAAATAWMKAVCTPLTLLKLYSVVLSVTTAVICFLHAFLYLGTHSQWRSE